jgi:hypothetical protein
MELWATLSFSLSLSLSRSLSRLVLSTRALLASAPVASHPIVKELLPPGGRWTRVDGRSVRTLPLFWFEPDAYAFEDVPRAAFGGATRAAAALTVAASGAAGRAASAAGTATGDGAVDAAPPPPKRLRELLPPGGAWIRVDERSVITLPLFWFEPDAKAFDDVPRSPAGDDAESVDDADAAGAAGTAVATLDVAAAALPPKRFSELRPPGGAWIRVVERSVIEFPAF